MAKGYKAGGNLILYLPNEKVYQKFCADRNAVANPGHQNPDLSLDWFKENIIARLDVDVIHENPMSGDYMFEIVMRKA